MKVYLNGEYVRKEEARISVDDRGFLLADGVYEVTPAYHGELFKLDRHLERLAGGLEALRIESDVAALAEVHDRLLELNELTAAPAAMIYIQVTRGPAAARTHGFPASTQPTVYAFARSWDPPGIERWEEGWSAVTVPDRRWARVDIKSIALLPNVLAQQAALDAGADESILVRDGVALEGAHANLFIVRDGALITHPRTHQILAGVTRETVLELADELGLTSDERPNQVEELATAEEVFLTGTTTEIRPIVKLNGRPVGPGKPGPISRRLFEAYRERVGA